MNQPIPTANENQAIEAAVSDTMKLQRAREALNSSDDKLREIADLYAKARETNESLRAEIKRLRNILAGRPLGRP